jgi:hypothetical protein
MKLRTAGPGGASLRNAIRMGMSEYPLLLRASVPSTEVS